MLVIKHAGQTDLGRKREQNEDNWIAHPELGLYVVADGMGGHLGGEVASKVVVEILPPLIRKDFADIDDLDDPAASERLCAALVYLSDHLRDGARGKAGLSGLGSTVVLFLIRGDKALIGQMGDSRAYLLRRGKLRRLTTDHSLVQLLLESGDITPEGAATHPACGQITRYVGMEGEALPEVQTLELRHRDKLLLCSDGLTGMVRDDEICAMLRRRFAAKNVCRRLIDAANEAGGKDNVTAVVMRVSEAKISVSP